MDWICLILFLNKEIRDETKENCNVSDRNYHPSV